MELPKKVVLLQQKLINRTYEAMLHNLLAEYHIPVLCGFPAGHGDINLPLVMGAPVTIDVRPEGSTLQFDIDGEQQLVNTAGF